jgi:arsenate reductase
MTSLRVTVESLLTESELIPRDRKERLQRLADWMAERLRKGAPVRLNFICTHNSRRSHMGQAMGLAAARHFDFSNVECYSGGTEGTAFFPSAIEALRSLGFQIERISAPEEKNPRYTLFTGSGPGTVFFSKRYDEEPNRMEDAAAVLVCSQADEACPVVPGASLRLSLPFEDPKAFDGTPEAPEKYLERARDIGREVLYAFSLAAGKS